MRVSIKKALPHSMGMEFKVCYLQPNSLSAKQLEQVAAALVELPLKDCAVAFVGKHKENKVYAIKYATAKKDSWDEDGLVYLSGEKAWVVFHVGTNNQIQPVLQWIENLFKQNSISVKVEEA